MPDRPRRATKQRSAAKAAKKTVTSTTGRGTRAGRVTQKTSAPRAAAADLEIRAFADAAAFAKWLGKHHARKPGVRIRFYKKDSGVKTITYAEALDEALCWGWIDGQTQSHDAASWLQRFTPRRARSAWSKRNRDHVARLEKAGRMQADGRWDRAYDSPANAKVPDDFMAALSKHKRALAFFGTLTRVNHYAIAYRLHGAKKPETRQRRFELFLQMLIDGKPIV